MADSPEQLIAAQAREIEQLKAARNVPNTAAADMAGILNMSNTTLQSDKNDLEAKIVALTQQITGIAQRNAFLEAELAAASHLLKQTIPAGQNMKQETLVLQVQDQNIIDQENKHSTALQPKNKKLEQVKDQIVTLQARINTLEQENAMLRQRNHHLGAHQTTLLLENEGLHDFCRQWATHSAQQGAELASYKENIDILHASLVRKTWRLHVQKGYLDRARIAVMEFEAPDDTAVRAWAAEAMFKIGIGAGAAGVQAAAIEIHVTPVQAEEDHAAVDIHVAAGEGKQTGGHQVPK
ncbi:uncharacterized protein RCC_04681 [Ramularia collo-cygni]|uniref:Uncharacterized protein n=1 Tax=Ramularia collo-cygni TaxID=112498 RepID=A0A2D3V5M3_9PEZI|nr:uncharacterized protein RCC_04681 [Ramularia collo-cygni]CZT18836.1 uncharacterized protein RCC_04681 [Ramularia collo-cygni]